MISKKVDLLDVLAGYTLQEIKLLDDMKYEHEIIDVKPIEIKEWINGNDNNNIDDESLNMDYLNSLLQEHFEENHIATDIQKEFQLEPSDAFNKFQGRDSSDVIEKILAYESLSLRKGPENTERKRKNGEPKKIAARKRKKSFEPQNNEWRSPLHYNDFFIGKRTSLTAELEESRNRLRAFLKGNFNGTRLNNTPNLSASNTFSHNLQWSAPDISSYAA